jgi:hypothetical protein
MKTNHPDLSHVSAALSADAEQKALECWQALNPDEIKRTGKQLSKSTLIHQAIMALAEKIDAEKR